MKIYPSVVIILTICLMSCHGASLSENILNSIQYKGEKVLEILEETKTTSEDIIDIKKDTLYKILSLKTNAFLNVVSRAKSALDSIFNIKADIIRHKADEISDIFTFPEAKAECETVDVEVPMEICQMEELCETKAELQCLTEEVLVCTEEQPEEESEEVSQQQSEEDPKEVSEEDPKEDNVEDTEEDTEEDPLEESEKDSEERDGSLCQWIPQEVCSVVDVEKCGERPLCREMVRTVRREICPDSE